jgi:putative peptidoglycan lipid II flippase
MLSRVDAAEAALYQSETPAGTVSVFERVKGLLATALPKGGVLLAVLFVVNAAMGLLKTKVLAHQYGGGPELDAFYAAQNLPSLALNLLVAGGVIGPFLPLFVGLKNEAEETAREFARTILTCAIIVMAVAMAIVFVFAPQTASFMAPGFSSDQVDLYAGLLRVMCLSQIVFAASFVLGEVLVAERRFATYALGDFFYYGGIALGAWELKDVLGIYGAAVGVLIGALGHLGIRLVGIYRTSFRPRASLALRTKGVGEFLRLMGPKMLSQPVSALMVAYFASMASTLAPGSITNFTFASEFQSVGETMIGLAFATAAFPALSAAASAGDKRAFKRAFTTNLLTIGVLSTGVCLGLLVFGGFAIRFFLSGGAFDATDVAQTTMILAILAISIPFESLVELFARAIFATRNTVLPTVAAWTGFVMGVGATWMLSSAVGLAAIPIGYATCRVVQLAVLAVALRPRMARIGGVSRWSRTLVGDRWGEQGQRPIPAGQFALVALLLAGLIGGTVFTGAQALSHSTILGQPQTTPWARAGGTRAPLAIATVNPSGAVSSTDPYASIDPSAKPSGAAYGFAMDLYQAARADREADFVGEFKDTWCVPAAMQTSMNIMSAKPDTTRDTQAKLFDLAVSIAGSSSGGTDPTGWAEGLAVLGYGHFKVDSTSTINEAIRIVAKQIRVTQRPAGLIVWRGWHSWVVSGFTATADPAVTDAYSVISLRIEDVWYPRISSLWSRSRNGASRPPDSDVLVGQLPEDYLPWSQGRSYPDRDGRFVFVIPIF